MREDRRSGGAPADAEIAAAIDAVDHVRGAIGGAGRDFKEWQHFAVLAPALDLLVNFSLCDDPYAPDGARPVVGRVVCVVRDEGGWDGDVDQYRGDAVYAARGCTHVVLGASSLVFRDGVFAIDVTMAARPIRVRLRLRPVTMPAYQPSVPMLAAPPLHWAVVPRLEVAGEIEVAGRRHVLDGALAYHDHNWGRFPWGHDVAWDWGFVLPADPASPWTTTFVRLTNRDRTVALAHGALVWRGHELRGVFRERELAADASLGHARVPRPFKVPRPMALVAPETAVDVPAGLVTRAENDAGWIECACDVDDLAQVLIPSEVDLGVTIFNEATAAARVRGRLGGEHVAIDGRAVLEFIRVV